MDWLREQWRIYFENATATRDYRVQMRGSRSLLVFGGYTLVLVLTAILMYYQTQSSGEVSVIAAQSALQAFFRTNLALLAAAICLITPALSATAIVTESKRKSLDLVFSAPVEPKYYLVGKAISAYRYVWMLLALSLPITATCVVLGGATWQDVLVIYALLSFHSLVLTAGGLLFSSIAPNANIAISWTYLATLIYCIAGSIAAASGLAFAGSAIGANAERSPLVVLSPFTVADGASTYTTIAGVAVPNWIFAFAACAFASKFLLALAGAALSPPNTNAIAVARIHGMVATVVFFACLGFTAGTSTPVPGQSMTFFAWGTFVFIGVAYFAAPYGFEGARRLYPNGAFGWRHMLDGTPAGALPYLFSLLLLAAIAYAPVAILRGGFSLVAFAGSFAFAFGFWLMLWGVMRLGASLLQGVRTARTMLFAFGILAIVMPGPALNLLAMDVPIDQTPSIWDFWFMSPLFPGRADRIPHLFVFGALMGVAGVVMFNVSERWVRKLIERARTVPPVVRGHG